MERKHNSCMLFWKPKAEVSKQCDFAAGPIVLAECTWALQLWIPGLLTCPLSAHSTVQNQCRNFSSLERKSLVNACSLMFRIKSVRVGSHQEEPELIQSLHQTSRFWENKIPKISNLSICQLARYISFLWHPGDSLNVKLMARSFSPLWFTVRANEVVKHLDAMTWKWQTAEKQYS